MTIGILGGTGPQVEVSPAAGHPIVIGSRSVEPAQAVAAECAELGDVTGAVYALQPPRPTW